MSTRLTRLMSSLELLWSTTADSVASRTKEAAKSALLMIKYIKRVTERTTYLLSVTFMLQERRKNNSNKKVDAFEI